MSERVITIVYCSEKGESIVDDRIRIEFSPRELSAAASRFKDLALHVEEYSEQTEMRDMYETFYTAWDMWNDMRRSIDG